VSAIVILHTVPSPTPTNDRTVCWLADRAVVMTDTAKDRLLSLYEIGASVGVTTPHGASMPTVDRPDRHVHDHERPQLLTWGLLGPEGIEHTIDHWRCSAPAAALHRGRHPHQVFAAAAVTDTR
jgi:hypothetical protein